MLVYVFSITKVTDKSKLKPTVDRFFVTFEVLLLAHISIQIYSSFPSLCCMYWGIFIINYVRISLLVIS